MEVVYKKRAINTLIKTAIYVESKNTKGAGDRWLEKVRTEIRKYAASNVRFALCKHSSLVRYKYSCFTYRKWVVAFRITGNKLEVCRFIWGAKLS